MKGIHSFWEKLRDSFEKMGKDPSFDWYFSLSMFGVALILVILFSVYLRAGFAEAPVAGDSTEQHAVFNRQSVDEALEAISQKKKNASVVPKAVLVDPAR
jgi:hypothetical protein